MRKFFLIVFFAFLGLGIFAHNIDKTVQIQGKKVHFYLFLGGDYDNIPHYAQYLKTLPLEGVQILFAWPSLETAKEHYDFSNIDTALKALKPLHKKLMITIQDRSFVPKRIFVPKDMRGNPYYGGGATRETVDGDPSGQSGWVANQWNAHVRNRFQKLLSALAKHYDNNPNVVSISFPETAIGIPKNIKNYTNKAYVQGTIANMLFAKKVFHKTMVIQKANFVPGDEWPAQKGGYLDQIFTAAMNHHIGIGGPDILPWNKPHMANSYKFLHLYKGKIYPVSLQFQSPDYGYINPKTHKPYTMTEVVSFATNYLNVNYIGFTTEGKFKTKVIPYLKTLK